ncbi:hypothetical protein QNH98_13615 [Myroides sp. mNGS23_01]|nr:hypothetical protein [Myroides sp. mNGS23_01]WHT38108.1 hypothetical protein QNH98_13615 [Myroides sp. mNGS23_01]
MNPKLLLTGVLLFCCSLLVFPLNKASSFVPNENKDAFPLQTEIVFSDSGEITVENPFSVHQQLSQQLDFVLAVQVNPDGMLQQRTLLN